MRLSTKEAERALAQIANGQGGYFTARQARSAGYDHRHLFYHESAGNIEHVSQGLYRLPTVPFSEQDDFIRLTLWSRNQKDQPQAVISHESALVQHELSELLPRAIHLTVPKSFRKPSPRNCIVHKANLSPRDSVEHQGYRVTTPLRTLIDVAENGISQEQLEKAIADAIRRGLIQRSALAEAAKRSTERERIEQAMKNKRTR